MSNYCPNCGFCLQQGWTRWNYQPRQQQFWWPQQQPHIVIQIQGNRGQRYYDRPRATIEEIPPRQNQCGPGPQQGGNSGTYVYHTNY